MKQPIRLVYLLAIIRFVLPFLLVHPFYQLHRDEYLYLAEGHHPAWGFMEVPPMLSFMAWISNHLGTSTFWVKCWPALLGSATYLLVGKLIVSLGGRYFAVLVAFLPFLFTGLIRLFYFFHPNFLDVFFWVLSAYALIRHIQTKRHLWLYVLGVSVGLGMLSKYSVSFYTASLLVGLLFTKQRSLFRNKHLYFSGAIALLIMLPNLLWQYQHQFPVVQHMDELREEQLQFIEPLSFLKSQLLMFLPAAFIWLTGLCYTAFTREGKPYQVIAWAYVLVIGLLMALHGKDYYAIGTYPLLFGFGAYYLEKITRQRKIIRIVIVLVPVVLGVYIMPLLMPLQAPEKLAQWYAANNIAQTGALTWEDQQQHPLPQDFADMIGWRELAEKTAAVYHALPDSQQKATMIYCRGYYTAGALNYHAKSLGLPEVYSDQASFLFWMPDKYPFKHLLLIGKTIPEKDDIVFQQFEKMRVCDSIQYPMFRETGTKIMLFENGNDSLQAITERAVAGLKAKYRRSHN